MNIFDTNMIISNLSHFIDLYGLPLIFITSLIESIIFLGIYFPGTIIIFGIIASTVEDIKYFLLSIFLSILGVIIGYIIDYFIGYKYGLKIIKKLNLTNHTSFIQNKINSSGLIIVPLFFYLPGAGALTALILGSLRIKFKLFLSMIITTVIFWNILWGSVIYVFGDNVIDIVLKYFPIIIILIIIILIFKNRKEIFS